MAATTVLVTGLGSAEQVVLYFLLGTVGSLLPDMDSKSSAPVHIIFSLLATLLAFVAMFYMAGSLLSVAELLVIWLATYLAIRWLAFYLFNRGTDHRGLFHSVPAAILAAAITACLAHRLFELPPFEAWMSGCFVGLGYLLHLLLDELYSVHLFGMRQRRSLGTALKLYRKGHPIATACLYLAVAGTLLWAPHPDPFIRTVADPRMLGEIQRRFLPAAGWFWFNPRSESGVAAGEHRRLASKT